MSKPRGTSKRRRARSYDVLLLAVLAATAFLVLTEPRDLPEKWGKNSVVVKIYDWRDRLLHDAPITAETKKPQQGYDAQDRAALGKLINEGAKDP